ncbi:MAG: 50S ribosome-binding GTPase [Candidatus Thermoplasmatota archaeon]|jgi:nucleolar GTP-binding protein|nr:50S ribosome-binding GTPase [Candidatus Sysuiplasma jiujiangense]MBX8641615.1 50S ribosome-binding GTPase [Candidatus Sysuiplasma jiujiangense]MCL4317578.1 50S ribosome-binding GTPase [Candidatus Thermoplasmatota archaeon]MCL5254162.1 50S ribosome-binding GTPase [Candidatus Thermoplasmatota archaeon]
MKLPRVMNAGEIIDYLFSAASKAQGSGTNALTKIRKRNINKLHTIGERADRLFSEYVTGFPSFEENTFEYELADLLVGVGTLKKAIASVHGCKNNVVTVVNRAAREVAKSSTTSEMRKAREGAYGRTASLIKGVDEDLSMLATASARLAEIPDIEGENIVVVAGFPNVGKSRFVSYISGARTRVEPYPFTTTELVVGHRIVAYTDITFVDIPGLTERAFVTGNQYEKKALLAIKHKARLMLYIIDPTGSCGCSLKDQHALFTELEKAFGSRRTIVAYSKADLDSNVSEVEGLHFSSVTGQGVDDLLEAVRRTLAG